MTRKMGNANNEPVTFYFEYELKSVKELLAMNLEQPLESYLKECIFQMVISYTQRDGSKFVRVCNMTQQVSHEKDNLEESANLEILSANAIQQSSKLARIGDIGKAQAVAFSWGGKLKKQAAKSQANQANYVSFKSELKPVYDGLTQTRKQPVSHGKMGGGMRMRGIGGGGGGGGGIGGGGGGP